VTEGSSLRRGVRDASFSAAGENGGARGIFRVLPPQVRMVWQLVTSYPDYLLQLSLLLRDPVYRGGDVPRGTGQPILLVPGFLVGDWTFGVMAGWLRRSGYHPYLSGIDWNVRAPERTADLLAQRISYIVGETGSPVILVGHSLGGMLARSLGSYFPALVVPQVVRHIIALGSPIHGSPHTLPSFIRLAFLALQSLGGAAGNAPPNLLSFIARVSAPLPAGVGFTAVFSIRDEIVDWRTCVDPQGDNYQVSGRHLGLVVNREVYRVMAGILGSLQPAA
jgi:triacylglycerol lipase